MSPEEAVMPRINSLFRLGALLTTACWMTGCSDPGAPKAPAQPPQVSLQKAPTTAKVALGPDTEVASGVQGEAPVLDSTAPDVAVHAAAVDAPQPIPAEASDAPPLVRAIDAAALRSAKARPPAGWTVKSVDPALIRAEVLLDRAGFSPGVIDGKDGGNLKNAVSAYAKANSLASDGRLNAAVFAALTTEDGAPTAQSYEITTEDVAGPFIGEPPKDYEALARLPALSYSTPEQALSEKFHMDIRLLKALNPGADFGKAGTRIVVAMPRSTPRAFTAARIEVDKAVGEVRAYDASDKLVALYPATVGSSERPAPSGTFKVTAVAPRPVYYYDPKRLTFQPQGATGKLKIAAGPNNPVGSTWIAITVPTYGIHGTPDPATIGKRQSHGCVRLTNWDAAELGKAVKKGAKVEFLGTEKKT
jgi:lipoprotein-anchoring transpeptidase ErfK/SrfK